MEGSFLAREGKYREYTYATARTPRRSSALYTCQESWLCARDGDGTCNLAAAAAAACLYAYTRSGGATLERLL